LTSLLDVLFILVFAALIHSAAAGPRGAVPQDAVQMDAGAIAELDAGIDAAPVDRSELRAFAIARLQSQVEDRNHIVVRVGRAQTGEWRITLEKDAQENVDLPLLVSVDDPEIGLVYAGDADPARSLCAQISAAMELERLDDYIVIVASSVNTADLPVALIRGLATESERCARERGGMLVLLSPEDMLQGKEEK
jgi:hypothetical protein